MSDNTDTFLNTDSEVDTTASDTPMVSDDTTTSEDTTTTSAPAAEQDNSSQNVVFVGSLAWATDSDSLRRHFEEAGLQIGEDETKEDGYVRKAVVVAKDRDTGRSKGYGFVTLSTPEEAQKAVDTLNNTELDGRPIRVQVKENRPQEDRPRRPYTSGGGGARGGSSFGGGNRSAGGSTGNRSYNNNNSREGGFNRERRYDNNNGGGF